MARPRVRPIGHETVNIWTFALPAVDEIATKAHVKGMPYPSRDDVASAAVWSVARLPPEVCKAVVEAYIAAEKGAHDAVCQALEAFFRG